MTYSSAPLIEALAGADHDALAALLTEDVAFNSPVATYEGAGTVVRVLGTAAEVIEGLRVDRELATEGETVTFITGSVGGKAVDGVLVQRVTPDEKVAEVTLMLRPLEALLAGVKEMQRRLS